MINYMLQIRLTELNLTQFIKMAQLDDCKLTRMPDLNFNFEGGACNTFTETTDDGTQDVVYLCFGDSEAKTCRT